jgi:hypothetical protein
MTLHDFMRIQVPYRLGKLLSWSSGDGSTIGSITLRNETKILFEGDALTIRYVDMRTTRHPYHRVAFGGIDLDGGKSGAEFFVLNLDGRDERFWVANPRDAMAFAQLFADVRNKMLSDSRRGSS